MIVTTNSSVSGHRITRTYGLVRGNTIRARHVGRDIMAGFRNLVGGEVSEYTKLMGEAREQALDRMVAEAQGLGANAILEVRPSCWPTGQRFRSSRSRVEQGGAGAGAEISLPQRSFLPWASRSFDHCGEGRTAAPRRLGSAWHFRPARRSDDPGLRSG